MIKLMTQWIPVLGAVTTALIGAFVVFLRARAEMVTRGSWERIKLLQEISEKLPEDELCLWLDRYIRFLIHTTAIGSTRVKVGRFFGLFVPAGIITLAGGCLGLAGVIADDTELSSIATRMFWAGFVLILACFFIPLAPSLPLGVSSRRANGEALALHKEIVESYDGVGYGKGTSLASDIFDVLLATKRESGKSAANEDGDCGKGLDGELK